MKKKNPLSLWTYSYRKSYYILHPWKWFYDTYWNFRNWIHRANRGYAYVDVWNFCDWYPRVAAEALRYLAAHGSTYPGVKPWSTPEEWREYLYYLANRLQRCADSQTFMFGIERNEYAEAFDKMMTRAYHCTKDGDIVRAHFDMTDEDKELRDKYFARIKELQEADRAYDAETFRWIGEDIGRIWD